MSTPPKTVWLCQLPTREIDLSSADRYGRIEALLTGDDRPSMRPGACIVKLRTRLREFREGDYLVNAGGDPIAPVLVSLVMGELGIKNFIYLRWERDRDPLRGGRTGTGYYVPVEVCL